MNTSKYDEATRNIADNIIQASSADATNMDEQTKQIVGAFCFGALNAYSLENKADAAQIHSAMIAMLIQKLKYDTATAVEFCDFLIRCTDRNFHSVMYAIIHRGIEGYYLLSDPEKLAESLSDIFKAIRRS